MSETQEKGVIGQVSENLGEVFRHLLPGILIICAAAMTHPSWFAYVNFNNWPSLVMVAAISIAVGNAWFSVNRYAIQQAFDYICYLVKLEGPAKRAHANYSDDLAIYVREALIEIDVPARARWHVAFRASSVLLIYTIAELFLFAAISSEPQTPTYGHSIALFMSAAVAFFFAIWQNVLSRRIDAAVLHKNATPTSGLSAT